MAGKAKKIRKINRSAETGQFVAEEYARTHPKTTVTETVKSPKKKRRK